MHERRVLVPLEFAPDRHVNGASSRMVRFDGEAMGTTWVVQCVVPIGGKSDAEIRREIVSVIDDVIVQMSNWRGDSDISRFNRASPGSWITVPSACFIVIQTALHIARKSLGAFDPTSGPLVDAWGFGPAPRRMVAPSPDEIQLARKRCGWQRVEIDSEKQRVLQPGGISLDLCAIAKGYAVDAVRHRLTLLGIQDMLVEIGGELSGEGVKCDGLPWWVEVESPTLDRTEGAMAADDAPPPDLVALTGLSIATSGDYRRFFLDPDTRQRYAHTLDPRTGYPASHGLASVTVLHPQCMLADAYSTAFTVLGPVAGMTLARSEQIAARFIIRTPSGFREEISPAYTAMLQ